MTGAASRPAGSPDIPGHTPASEQGQQDSLAQANAQATWGPVHDNVLFPGRAEASCSAPVAGPGQDRAGETTWKWQVTNLSSCHLEPPPHPVRSQAQQQSLKFTTCRVQVADLPSSVMGCCFYFPFIGETELLPVVTVAVKLLRGLRFTYRPRDLQQVYRQGEKKDSYSLIRAGD